MTERLTHNIYRIVSVGLFSNHQLTFSFLLCASIMRANVSKGDIAQVTASPMSALPTEEGEDDERQAADKLVSQVQFIVIS
jgi:hypothetical protein